MRRGTESLSIFSQRYPRMSHIYNFLVLHAIMYDIYNIENPFWNIFEMFDNIFINGLLCLAAARLTISDILWEAKTRFAESKVFARMYRGSVLNECIAATRWTVAELIHLCMYHQCIREKWAENDGNRFLSADFVYNVEGLVNVHVFLYTFRLHAYR